MDKSPKKLSCFFTMEIIFLLEFPLQNFHHCNLFMEFPSKNEAGGSFSKCQIFFGRAHYGQENGTKTGSSSCFAATFFLKHTQESYLTTLQLYSSDTLSLTSNEGKKKWSSCRVNSRKNFNWAPTLSTIETHQGVKRCGTVSPF